MVLKSKEVLSGTDNDIESGMVCKGKGKAPAPSAHKDENYEGDGLNSDGDLAQMAVSRKMVCI
jgi:hypothetical protein